jgi:hypothetical protein
MGNICVKRIESALNAREFKTTKYSGYAVRNWEHEALYRLYLPQEGPFLIWEDACLVYEEGTTGLN